MNFTLFTINIELVIVITDKKSALDVPICMLKREGTYVGNLHVKMRPDSCTPIVDRDYFFQSVGYSTNQSRMTLSIKN